MDDWRPYIFRTDDYGESWTLLTSGDNGIPEDHWVRVVREDKVQPGLLYAGTEFGVFVSFDDGGNWQPLQMNLPATPVTDMKVHKGDLVLSTQGRSFWILDDVTPLRELAAEAGTGNGSAATPARLFTPRDVARGRSSPPMSEMDLALPDPLPAGALISYVVTEEVEGLTLEIRDSQDRLVARWQERPLSSDQGFHRLAWPLRYQEDGGVKAPPGEYRARLSWDGGSDERSFRVLPNPADPAVTPADYEEQFRVTMEVQQTSREIREATERIRNVRNQTREIIARAREAEKDVGRLPELADSLEARLRPFEADLTSVDDPTVPTSEVRPEGGGLDREYGALMSHLNSGGGYGAGGTEGRPTAGAMEKKRDLDMLWTELRGRVRPVLDAEIEAFNAEVARLGLVGIVVR